MKVLTSFVAFLLFFAIVIVVAGVVNAAKTSQQQPAFVWKNPAPSSTSMLVSPIFASLNYTEYYSFTSTYDLNSGKTVVSEAALNNGDTSRWPVWTLDGSYKFDNNPTIGANLPSQVLPKTFIFTGRNTESGEAVSLRWASFNGLEWGSTNRGVLKGKNTELSNPSADLSYLVSSNDASGATEMLSGYYGKSATPVWTAKFDIPSANQQPKTSYAQDLTFLPLASPPTIAFISGSTIHAVNALNGTVLKKIENPCGYTGAKTTSLHISVVTPSVGISFLAVFGSITQESSFGICLLSADGKFTEIWNKPAFSGKSVDLASQSINSLAVIDIYSNKTVTPLLFFGLNNNEVYIADLETGAARQTLTGRLADEMYNMPVPLFQEGKITQVLISLGGKLVGYDPVMGVTKVTCADVSCAQNPVVYTKDGTSSRFVCSSATKREEIIAIDIFNKSQSCYHAWSTTISACVPLGDQQPTFAAEYIGVGSFNDPFVVFADVQSNIYGISFRANDEPVPTTPVPATTPAPASYPKPANHLITKPLATMKDPILNTFPTITQFNDGPIVSATALADITYKGNTTAMSCVYYQAVSFSGKSNQDYELLMYDEVIRFWPTQVSNIDAAKSNIAITAPTLNTGVNLILFSEPSSTTGDGKYDELPRWLSSMPVGTDGKGLVFYSTGAVDNVEKMVAVSQLGDGTKGGYKWITPLTAPSSIDNFTSHTGPVVYSNSFVYFSFFDSLYILDSTTGAQAAAPAKNPCGFSPLTSQYFVYDFMSMYPVETKAGNEPLLIAAVPTAANTYGLCAIEKANSASPTWSVTIESTTSISAVVSLPHQNIFVVDAAYGTGLLGYLHGHDLISGLEVFKIPRNSVVGTSIVAVPNTNYFLANTDVKDATTGKYSAQLSLVQASSGKVAASCPFALQYFTLVKDAASGSTMVVGNYLDRGAIVAAVKLNPSGDDNNNLCEVVWETGPLDREVVAVSNGLMSSESGDTKYVSLVTVDGSIHSVSLSPASAGYEGKVMIQKQSHEAMSKSTTTIKKRASILGNLKKH